jgi:hypothetical protein
MAVPPRRYDLPTPTIPPLRVPAGLRTDPSLVTMPSERLRSRRRAGVGLGANDVRTAGRVAAGPATARSKADDAAILALARARFELASTAESTLRQEMLEDLRFRAGEQWPDQIRADRTIDKRPVITVNRLPQFIKQITNPQRQARPSLQINPVGDGADQDTAEILQGLIRHIEQGSHAEVAFDEAYDDAVTIGRGWFRILTQYEDDGGFDQEIVVRRISNPFTVYVDPAAHELDYSDARFMFIIDDIPKDEYRNLFGDASMASLELFQSQGDRTPDWFPEGKVRIAEYWFIETEKRVMVQVRDVDNSLLVLPEAQVPAELKGQIVNRRELTDRKVHWVKMNAAEVLTHQIWPGRWIPIVPVLGDEVNVNGRKDLVGVVRYARDPQRMYNFWVSAQTEAIALAPRTPFIGAEGQFKGHEAEWKQANTRNFAYLEYAPATIGGEPAPPPQRQVAEPPINAIIKATMQADNDLKAVIGFYDASLGEKGPQESGRAILARQKQGETANVNYIDNLGRALWHYGRICLDLIPKIYDAPRTLHILGLDDQRRKVRLNEETVDHGVTRIYDVTQGRYNVTLSVGPTYQSRRQEAVASMLQLIAAAPNMLPIIGDLLVGEMDWPVARQISERLKKMLPPVLQDQNEQEQPDPQQTQAQLQQLQQLLQLQQQALTEAQQTIASRTIEAQSRERVAQITSQTQMAIAAAKMGGERDLALLEAEVKQQAQKLDMIHEATLASMEAQQQQGPAPDNSAAIDALEADRQRQFEAHQQTQDHVITLHDAERTRQHEMQMERARQQHEAALEGMRQEHEAGLDLRNRHHEAVLAETDREHETRQERTAQQHDTRQAELERRHAKVLETQRAKAAAAKAKATPAKKKTD